ncbi:hypothetical protein BOO69_12645 [Sulfitobacter alexandrii]|uniref:Uncharacterized protein n=1 Tax=Sulfitobacter alexandrii TaxID=1917485 RepID=A0A1J0WIK7_9RHOB|nr:hypothetical protein [Sulfitobacter alexandrii]APE44153.1 hypothetical protein BOO69_12645 [Sulfitobacter alexandrii]
MNNQVTRRAVLAAIPATGAALTLPAPIFAGPEASAELDPILSLPFVRDTTRAERQAGLPPRIFWSVEPSGDYMADCDTGSHFAHLAMSHMLEHNYSAIFNWAVFDMLRAGQERSGIEVGFLAEFAKHSMIGKCLFCEFKAGAV